MKRVLTGIKPSGRLHLGNYFSVVEPLLELQQDAENELFVFIANYHAMNTVHSKKELEESTLHILKLYLASGLDPEKTTIYLQSDVPEVQELAWFLASLTTMPELMRAHAFKDAQAKNKEIKVGTFTYPLLMASDILIMDADAVPVGKDQEQHLEMAREMARDFNNVYGEALKEPTSLIKENVATVPGTDGRKMSKSYDNIIPVIATDEEWQKAVFSIVTGSTPLGEPIDCDSCNIYALHKLINKENLPKITQGYKDGSIGYKESKELLLEAILEKFGPVREKYQTMTDDFALKQIELTRKKAQKIAREKILFLREKVGDGF